MPIRFAVADDAAAIARIYAPIVDETVISFEYEPPDEQELRERIMATTRTHPWIVFEEHGQVEAYAYATRLRARAAYDWVAEVSVYVGSAVRRRGVARALYTGLFGLLEAQGFTSVFAGVTLPNAASVSLHESMGLRPIGTFPDVGYKHAAWHAVGFWHMPLAPSPLDPRGVRAFEQFRLEPGASAPLERAASLIRASPPHAADA